MCPTKSANPAVDRLDLVFGRPASLDLDGAVGDLPSRLNAIGTDPRPDGITVHMQLKPDVVVRDFRSGHSIVLDLYDRNATNPAAAGHGGSAHGGFGATGAGRGAVAGAAGDSHAASTTALSAEPTRDLGTITAQPAAPEPALATDLQSALPQAADSSFGGGKSVPLAGAECQRPGRWRCRSPRRHPRPSSRRALAPPAVGVKVSALPMTDGATLYFDWPKPVALRRLPARRCGVASAFDAPGQGGSAGVEAPRPGADDRQARAGSLRRSRWPCVSTGGKAASVTTAAVKARVGK